MLRFHAYIALGLCLAATLFIGGFAGPLHAGQDVRLFLPLALTPPTPAQLAIERVNHYRAIAGVPAVELNSYLTRAAQNHADYIILNADDPSTFANPHGEARGHPGFTGIGPTARVNAIWPEYADYLSYIHGPASEAMHWLSNPVKSVDGLIDAPYHRIILLEADLELAGYGISTGKQKVDVFDFLGRKDSPAGKIQVPLVYPGDGQTDVPIDWNGAEAPSPLPAGVRLPVGYPITLQKRSFVGSNILLVTSAELRDAMGNLVPVHPNAPGCVKYQTCAMMIAISPFNPNSTYTVHVTGSLKEVPFDLQWRFTTAAVSP